MASRNQTYISAPAGCDGDPDRPAGDCLGQLEAWTADLGTEFALAHEHEKAAAARDAAAREVLRAAVVARLERCRNLLLVVSAATRGDADWIPFEIACAVDQCRIPIIAAYPDYDAILAPAALCDDWPDALDARIASGAARVIHVPFRRAAVRDAIIQFGVENDGYPSNGYGCFDRDTQARWGLIGARTSDRTDN